jgi:hypothetical protein
VAWVPLPAPGAPNRIKRMVISPNRIETAALRGLSGIRSLWHIARLKPQTRRDEPNSRDGAAPVDTGAQERWR